MNSGTKTIWFDLDNSPHVPLFAPVVRELEGRGYSLLLTSRDCFQVTELTKIFGLNCRAIGTHHGKNLAMKVTGTLVRAGSLVRCAYPAKPALAVSHGSRAQILCAAALRIPTLVMLDYEHSNALDILRPRWVMAPDVIPKESIRYRRSEVLNYPGIKEDLYVPSFRPDPDLRRKLGIPESELLVTVRPPANEAHYHNPESDVLYHGLMEHLGRCSGLKVLLVPRTPAQANVAKSRYSHSFAAGKFMVPEHAVDGLSLIWISDLVVSGGGTMNREAAALGVPVYSIFRGPTGAIDQYLQRTGKLQFLRSIEDVQNGMVLQKRSQKSVVLNHAALRTVVDHLLRLLNGSSIPLTAPAPESAFARR
jgi:predicted glycosyltransferase